MSFLTNDKLVIVGAGGAIGSTMVQTALTMKLTPNVCLYDVYAPGMEGVMEEMFHCGYDGVNLTATTDVAEAFKDAKYIISSGGAPRKEGMTREDLLAGNCKIAEELGKNIKTYCPDVKHVVVIFNPADLTGLVTLLYSGLKPGQVTTLAALDSTRLQSALAKKFGVKQYEVTGCATYGGHGEQMAVFGSAVKVAGTPLYDLIGTEACTNEEWDSYFRNFEFMNMNTTLVPVAGNHEGNLQWFKFNNMFNIGAVEDSATITGCYYSFDWGDAHFAVLNSNDMYPMSASQINWLKNDMNASNAQWKIVLMHRALYSAGKNINKPDTVIMRNLLLPVIDELGIDVVFAGHDHMYMRTESVKDEKVQDVQTVTEIWNGESTTFAVNPDGTTHILPSTAGTKRYGVNEEAMPPILESSAIARDTKDGGVFATVSLDSNHFVYKAYMVDDETGEKTLIDTYAIKKTDRETVNDDYEDLPTDIGSTAGQHGITLVVEILKMLVSYIKLLFSVI